MPNANEQIETLRRFNEKVQELVELSFVKAISDPKAGFSIKADGKKMAPLEFNHQLMGQTLRQ